MCQAKEKKNKNKNSSIPKSPPPLPSFPEGTLTFPQTFSGWRVKLSSLLFAGFVGLSLSVPLSLSLTLSWSGTKATSSTLRACRLLEAKNSPESASQSRTVASSEPEQMMLRKTRRIPGMKRKYDILYGKVEVGGLLSVPGESGDVGGLPVPVQRQFQTPRAQVEDLKKSIMWDGTYSKMCKILKLFLSLSLLPTFTTPDVPEATTSSPSGEKATHRTVSWCSSWKRKLWLLRSLLNAIDEDASSINPSSPVLFGVKRGSIDLRGRPHLSSLSYVSRLLTVCLVPMAGREKDGPRKLPPTWAPRALTLALPE